MAVYPTTPSQIPEIDNSTAIDQTKERPRIATGTQTPVIYATVFIQIPPMLLHIETLIISSQPSLPKPLSSHPVPQQPPHPVQTSYPHPILH